MSLTTSMLRMLFEVACILAVMLQGGMYIFLIAAAVQRKYESLRRQWTLDEKENSDEIKKETPIRKKYRQRLKRVSNPTYGRRG